jgi:hypothetical protein
MDITGISTTLELQRIEHRWLTKDDRVTFRKRKRGWAVSTISSPIYKAFREYGVISSIEDEHTCFPSLKMARQAVGDVSLEAGLNIDTRLTRQRSIAYKIGDLPLIIKRQKGYWRVYAISSALSQSLKKYFNSTQEFQDVWESTDSALVHYPTRKAALQAAIIWLSQTVAKGK